MLQNQIRCEKILQAPIHYMSQINMFVFQRPREPARARVHPPRPPHESDNDSPSPPQT